MSCSSLHDPGDHGDLPLRHDRLSETHACTNRDVDHLVNVLPRGKLYDLLKQSNHEDLPLRHDGNRRLQVEQRPAPVELHTRITGTSPRTEECPWSDEQSGP